MYLILFSIIMTGITVICFYIEVIRNRTTPFALLVSLYYLFFFGFFSLYVAGLTTDRTIHFPEGFPTSLSADAFAILVLFAILQIFGFLLPGLMRKGPPADCASPGKQRVRRAALFAIGLCLFHFTFYVFPSLGSVVSLSQLKSTSWFCGIGILSYCFATGKLTRLLTHVLWLLLAIEVLIVFETGSLTNAVLTVAIMCSAFLMARRIRAALCTAAVIIAAMPLYGYVKAVNRSMLHNSPVHIHNFSPDLSLSSVSASFQSFARRSAPALLFQHVVNLTPSHIPYSDHNPLLRAALNHIPRVIWPGKPEERQGNSFGRTYGILDAGDDVTSWNIPWVVDFYKSFGPVYTPLIGMLVGLGLGLVMRAGERMEDRVIFFGIYAAAVFPLFYQESNFSVMTGSFFWTIAVYYVLYLLFTGSVYLAAGVMLRSRN